MKKFLKWFGGFLALIFLVLLLIPIVFKGKIKSLVLEEANKTLNAEFHIDDVDLTLLSTFPNLTIQIEGTSIKGKDEFEGVTLLDVHAINLGVNLSDIISGDEISIKSISVTNAFANIFVLENGKANYDIVKASEENDDDEDTTTEDSDSSFKIALDSYSINNLNLIYEDNSSHIFTEIKNLNHSGNATIAGENITLNTISSIDALTVKYENIKYFNEVNTKANINLGIGMLENGYAIAIKENQINLNKFIINADGNYFYSDDLQEMDIKLKTEKTTFKDLLSLVPTFYHTGYESMLADGKLAASGFVKGKLTEELLPAWDFKLVVNNGVINYPELPKKITGIEIDTDLMFPGGSDLDLMKIDVNNFEANLDKNKIQADLKLAKPMSDMHIISDWVANVDLSTLDQFIPLEKEEKYSGLLACDIHLNGNLSDLEKEKYDNFKAIGTLKVSDMNYISSDFSDPVNIQTLLFKFTPENLILEEFAAKIGASDFNADGKIDNYLAYALKDEMLHGNFNFNASKIVLDDFLSTEEEIEEQTEQSETEEENTPTETEPTIIPDNIDFTLNAKVDELIYDGTTINNSSGKIIIKDEIASLDNLKMETLGGRVVMNGAFNTQDHAVPKVNFDYDITNVDINQVAVNFNTVEKLAPVVKYAQGKISSKFHFESDLDTNLDPIVESVNGKGEVRSNEVKIGGLKVLEKMSETTLFGDLSNQTFKNFYTKFTIQEGKLYVEPFDVKIAGIPTTISGYNTIDQKIDYDFRMQVPKDKLPGSLVSDLEKEIAKLNSQSSLININALPENIPVHLSAQGDFNNPKITTDYKDVVANLTKDLKQNLTKQVKESVNNLIKEEVAKAKKDISKEKEKIFADAKRESDKLMAEAKKQGDFIRAEAKKQGDALIEEAGSDFLQKTLAKEGAKKLNKEADKQIKKLEAKAQQQVDKIMANAKAKVDQLEVSANQ